MSTFPRTGLQLHDLDQQDEARLLFCLYGLVRIGLLDEAQVCTSQNGEIETRIRVFVSFFFAQRVGI